MINNHVPTLARCVSGEAAQRTLLTYHPGAVEALSENPALAPSVWDQLAKKSKATVAVNLAARPLTEAQLDRLIKDKRITVRNTLMSRGLVGCTEAMAEKVLAADWFSSEHAMLWLTAKSVPASCVKRVAVIENHRHMIRKLADRDMFSFDEALELLFKARMVGSRGALWSLFDMRPELIAPVLENAEKHQHMLEAVAGSRHIFDRAQFVRLIEVMNHFGMNSTTGSDMWMTLVLNPNVPTDLLDSMLEHAPARVSLVLHRYRPERNYELIQKLNRRRVDYAAFLPVSVDWAEADGERQAFLKEAIGSLHWLRYPTLHHWKDQASRPAPTTSGTPRQGTFEEVRDSVVNPSPGTKPVFLKRDSVNELEALLDPRGESAWETFWSLIDGWQGTFGELVETSIELSV